MKQAVTSHYTPSIRLFSTAQPAIVVPADEIVDWSFLTTCGFCVVGLKEVGLNWLLLHDVDGTAFTVRHAPFNIVLLTSQNQANARMLALARAALIAAGESIPPAVEIVTGGTFLNDKIEPAVRHVVAQYERTQHYVVELAGSLTYLRQQYEEMQIRFRLLEQQLSRSQGADLRLRLELAPSDRTDRIVWLGAEGITQRLPVGSTGLGTIEVFVREVAAPRNGRLKAVLSLIGASDALAEWSVALADLSPGWIALGLPRCLGGVARSCAIDLAVEEGGEADVGLSLTEPHPISAYYPTGASGLSVATGSIALRLWDGVRGVRYPTSRLTVAPKSVGQLPSEPGGWLSALELARICPVAYGDAAAPSISEITFDLDRTEISLAVGLGTACGVIEAALSGEALRIAALGSARDSEGADVEVALAVGCTGVRQTRFDAPLRLFIGEVFDAALDWRRISAFHQVPLQLFVAAAADANARRDLYFFARPAEGKAAASARAVFSSPIVDILADPGPIGTVVGG